MNRCLFLLLLCFAPLSAGAQKLDSLMMTDAYLDTVQVAKGADINNYFLIGANYGVSFSTMYFNPDKLGSTFVFSPHYVSVMLTHYEKLFDYIPNFALMVGVSYLHEGFAIKNNPDTGNPYSHVDGATTSRISVVEIPAMAQIHTDVGRVKLMVDVGAFVGYRLEVNRSGPSIDKNYEQEFRDYEYRFDYGLEGGVGLALMFDPVEIHFNIFGRWSWESLYRPDYNSQYYYRFANPIDIMPSIGVHFQLTKRTGKTTAQLRQQAKEIVYGKTENTGSMHR
ncbi:MAG: PorT family protein [Bacteroidales bacterium]|nr:PorT family protein [Bacteroidales bacterium]